MILKPFNVIKMSRNYRESFLKKWRSFYCSKTETTISINIPSSVFKSIIHGSLYHGIFKLTSNRLDSPTEITRADVDEVVRTLLNNNAYTIMDNIEGEDKFGTAPVRDAYFALTSTQMTGNLDAVAGFIHKNQYPAPMNALRSEWGAIGNLRFLVSSIGSVSQASSALGNDVYNIFCVGMEAYACIEQDGYSASFIYRPPIYDGPLALNASVGYKFAEVPRICNDLWIINLKATLA